MAIRAPDKGQMFWQMKTFLTKDKCFDKWKLCWQRTKTNQRQNTNKGHIFWQKTSDKCCDNDKYCDKRLLIDWKQNTDKQRTSQSFTASHVLTRRRLHFKDAGHLTKASHTL